MPAWDHRFNSTAARKLWVGGWAEGRAEGQAEGEIRGKSKAVLMILEERSVPVTEAIRWEIRWCKDLDILDRRLLQPLKVTTAEELFA
ncbi:hypothetical protein [Nonomuraea sp. B19D2]|uniref:hypothetical protein n=1 Tax=Nonomuraea sp. B19D2 TaxID=3159561 RepID=UPI0032DB06A7